MFILMKKVTTLAVAVLMSASVFAQSNDGSLHSQKRSGQEGKETAAQPGAGQEKGQAVAEAAKARSLGAKGNRAEASQNHGTDVKAVATDPNLAGREKGEAVSAVASSKGKTMKPTGKGRPADAGKPATVGRPEQAGKPAGVGRPTTAGRPSGAGRPAGSARPAGAGRPTGAGRPGGN